MARRPGRQYYQSGRIKPLPRDYHQEQIRRDALARTRGHANRQSQRKKIERGKIAPLQPKRVRSPKTLEAQEKRLAKLKPPKPKSASYDDRELAYDWSAAHAQRIQATYNPELAALLGVTRHAYTKTYLEAFITGDFRYTDVRHDGGSEELFYWFVTLNHFYTAREYERRYAIR